MQQHESELHVGYLVFEVSRLMRRLFEEETKRLGLTLQQARVISFLHHQSSETTQIGIAHAIGIDPMTLSGILDRLQKRGVVAREQAANDSRAKQVILTEQGKALYREVRAVGEGIGQKLYDRALSSLEPAQRESLVAGLEIIRNELNDMSSDHEDTRK